MPSVIDFQAKSLGLETGQRHGSDERDWSAAPTSRPFGDLAGNPDANRPAAERRDANREGAVRTQRLPAGPQY